MVPAELFPTAGTIDYNIIAARGGGSRRCIIFKRWFARLVSQRLQALLFQQTAANTGTAIYTRLGTAGGRIDFPRSPIVTERSCVSVNIAVAAD